MCLCAMTSLGHINTRLLPPSLTRSLPPSLPPSLTHSLTHPLPPSLPHSLPHSLTHPHKQQDVTIWLEKLGMEEYTEVFHRAGYKTEDDVENLKELNEKELKRMGIVKMGTFSIVVTFYRTGALDRSTLVS